MKINKDNLVHICLRYIAIVVLPVAVTLTAAWVWNKTFNPQEKVDTEMQVLSLDQQQVITIHAGAKITRQDIPPTLPNPTVSTTLPEPTTVPTIEPTLAPQLMARISHYNPRLLGVNCHPDNILNGECTSWLSDGAGSWAHWSFYENWGLACPKTYSLGTKFAIEHFPSSSQDGYWTCVDRGTLISVLPDSIRLDLLTPNMPYVHQGDIVKDKWSPSGSYVVKVEIVHTP